MQSGCSGGAAAPHRPGHSSCFMMGAVWVEARRLVSDWQPDVQLGGVAQWQLGGVAQWRPPWVALNLLALCVCTAACSPAGLPVSKVVHNGHSVALLSFTRVPRGRGAHRVRAGCMHGHPPAELPRLHGSPQACLCSCRSAHQLALLRDQSSLSRFSSAIDQPHLLALSSLSRDPSRQVSPGAQRGAAAGQGQGAAPGAVLAEEAGAQPATDSRLVSLDDVWVRILARDGTPQVSFLPGIVRCCMRTCSWA